MARIGQEELRRLKEEVSLEALVRAKGLGPLKKGKDLLAACPFHEGARPPSMHGILGKCRPRRRDGKPQPWMLVGDDVLVMGFQHSL